MKKTFEDVREHLKTTDLQKMDSIVKYMSDPETYQEELNILKAQQDAILEECGWTPEEFQQAYLAYIDALPDGRPPEFK